jgi:hypothetical protein
VRHEAEQVRGLGGHDADDAVGSATEKSKVGRRDGVHRPEDRAELVGPAGAVHEPLDRSADLSARGRRGETPGRLFQNLYTPVARAEKLQKVSNPTARSAITAAVGGILEEISGRAWGRLCLARPILPILEG